MKRIFILFSALIACSHVQHETSVPMTPAPLSIKLPSIHRRPSFDFFYLQNANVDAFSLLLSCPSGTASDPDGKEGLTFVSLRTMVQATISLSRRSMIQKLDGRNARLEPFAQTNSSGFSLSGPATDFHELVATLQEVILQPRMDPKDLADTIDLFSGQTLHALMSPESLAEYASYAHFFKSRERLPATGSLFSLREIELEDAFAFHRTFRACRRWTVALAGPWTPDTAKARAEKAFQKLLNTSSSQAQVPPAKPEIQNAGTILFIDKRDSDFAQIIFLRRFPEYKSASYLPLQLAMHAFGGGFSSRLNQELREKRGLTYGAQASYAADENLGILMIKIGTKEDNIDEVLRTTDALWNKLISSGMTDSEVIRAKNYMMGQYPFSLQFPAAILTQSVFLDRLKLPQERITQLPMDISSLTPEQINSVLATELPQSPFSITVVGSQKAAQLLEKIKIPMTQKSATDYFPVF